MTFVIVSPSRKSDKKEKKKKNRMAIAKLSALKANAKTRIVIVKLFALNSNAKREKITATVKIVPTIEKRD